MTACEEMLPLILRNAEDALDEPGRVRLATHVKACATCREALAAQTEIRQLLVQVPFPEVSGGFAVRVRAQAMPSAGWLGLLNWRTWTLGLAPVAAMLCLLAIYAGREGSNAASTSTVITTWAQGSNGHTAKMLDPTADLDSVFASAMGEAK
jgi:hypothetical protein